MRVALIQPPHTEEERVVPTGMLCLASYIRQYNHRPIIIDLNIVLKEHISSPGYFKKVAQKILHHHPQVIGFTVICSTLAIVLLIAKECKKLSPDIPLLFGGPEVTFDEVEILKTFKQVDLIVRGEGEITFVEVLQAIEGKFEFSNILGLTYRDGKRITRNADRPFIDDLDNLPELNYSLLPHLEKYERGRIEAGRGCPFCCTFCSTCRMWKMTFRIKSSRRLATELKKTHSIFKGKGELIPITHDNFLASKKRVEDFLSLIVGTGIAWSCSARMDHLDEKLIAKLRKAGCENIYLGIESGSPRVQKLIKKNLPLSGLNKILDMLYQRGIETCLSFIIGFPGERKADVNQTLAMALRARAHPGLPMVQLHSFTFNKGSELYFAFKNRSSKRRFGGGQTDGSPLLTGTRAEKSLIKKYPRVFSSYYFLNGKDFSSDFIIKTCIVFSFLIQVFPFTAYLLMDFLSLQPVQFCEKIIDFLDSHGLRWKMFFEEAKGFEHFEPFINKFVANNSDPFLAEVFQHESVFAKSNYLPAAPDCNSQINMNTHPKIQSRVEIKKYYHDLIAFISDRKFVAEEDSAKEYYIAYVPGKEAKAVPLSPSHYYLLLLCKGKLSVHDIIRGVQDGKQGTKRAKKTILQKLQFLQKQGIISAA